jgi:Cdc6-like AAA superfamily ATPase
MHLLHTDIDKHTVILGSRGSGKTALVKYAVKELKRIFSNVNYYYVNCIQSFDTSYKIVKYMIEL